MGAVSSATSLCNDLDQTGVTELLDLAPSQAWRKDKTKASQGSILRRHIRVGRLDKEMRGMPLLSQLAHWSQILKDVRQKYQSLDLELNCSRQ